MRQSRSGPVRQGPFVAGFVAASAGVVLTNRQQGMAAFKKMRSKADIVLPGQGVHTSSYCF